jgi:hypothetical protein
MWLEISSKKRRYLVLANLRQRVSDVAIAEINKKADLNIALESLGRSRHRRAG